MGPSESFVQVRNFMVRRTPTDPSVVAIRNSRTFGELAEFARKWLDRNGFGNCRNRLIELCDAVTGITDPVGPDDPRYPLLDVAMHDLTEIVFIMESTESVVHQPLFYAKLQACLADDATPREGKASHGRDAQFDALLGAIALHSGLRVAPGANVRGGPDWVVRHSKAGQCSIEVKRVKSRSDGKFTTRIIEAFDQIDGLGHPGIAVLDVTPRGNPGLRSLNAPDEHLREYNQYSGDKGAEFLLNVVFPKVTSRVAAGVVIHETVLRSASGDGARRAGLVSLWNYTENPGAYRKARRCARRVWKTLSRGLPRS